MTKMSEFRIDVLIGKSVKTSIMLLASAAVFSSVGLVKQDAANAINIVIDSFTDSGRLRIVNGVINANAGSASLLGATSNPNAYNTATSISTVRGQRFNITSGTIDPSTTQDVSSLGGSFRSGTDNSGFTVIGYSAVARWAGASPLGAVAFGTQGSLNLDLTSGGTNEGIFLTRTSQSNIQAGSNLAITVFDGTNSQTVIKGIDITNTQSIYTFLFTDFAGVDFTTVSAIDLSVNYNNVNQDASTNFNFQTLQAAPVPFGFEPTVGITILGAGFGLNKLRKKLKAKQETKV